MFGTAPPYFGKLMWLRDKIVAPFGLKTGASLVADPVKRVGFFKQYSVTDTEIILGEDDRHLNFRVSINRYDDRLAISTWVHRNNWIGRVYLWIAHPFHHVLSRLFLSRTARHFDTAR